MAVLQRKVVSQLMVDSLLVEILREESLVARHIICIAVLILSHGSAPIESGLSINGDIHVKNLNENEESLVARHIICNVVYSHHYNYDCHLYQKVQQQKSAVTGHCFM